MTNGMGPAFWGRASEAITAIEYTTTAIHVWVIANDEDAAREIVEDETTFKGLLSVDTDGTVEDDNSLYLFVFEGAENA